MSQPKIKNQVHQERDGRVWWACVVGVVCGIFVAGGFAFAAHQHFTALENGAKNVELRKKMEALKGERRRLLLERETALSPGQLEKSALKIGLQNLNAKQINRLEELSFAPVEETAPEALMQNQKTSLAVKKEKSENKTRNN